MRIVYESCLQSAVEWLSGGPVLVICDTIGEGVDAFNILAAVRLVVWQPIDSGWIFCLAALVMGGLRH